MRGLHCDFKSWKMITCVYGKFLLVAVNMKKNSKNYLKHKKWILDYKKPKMILIPPYYANGHLCITTTCIMHYKWSYKGKYIDAKNQKTYKLRTKILQEHLNFFSNQKNLFQLFKYYSKENKVINDFVFETLRKKIEPKIVVDYNRRPYINKFGLLFS